MTREERLQRIAVAFIVVMSCLLLVLALAGFWTDGGWLLKH